jgi:putative ABC transport system permease protein
VSTAAIATMPIVAARRIRLAESLAAGGRSGVGLARSRANRVLVVSEVALALTLLVGAGLMLRSLSLLGRAERGFNPDGVLIATLQAWSYYPTPERRADYVRQAEERLRAIPGVEVAGMVSSLPLSWPIGQERVEVTIEGQPLAPGNAPPMVRAAAATPGYFAALHIPVVEGRGLTTRDVAGAPWVVLVNRAFARRHLGSTSPVGKHITFAFHGRPVAREIVGVVGDVRHEGLHADPSPGVFIPHAQAPTGAIHLVVRSSQSPALLERAVRTELTALNGAMPLSDMTTMSALVGRSLRERRFNLGLLSCFSAAALVLAAIGLYGVMSGATQERTHEIGVRMAVGANAGEVRWMVLRGGGVLALTGIVAGSIIALGLSRYMQGMLFGVTPLDPVTYASAATVLLATAVLSTLVPAWRASRVDPVTALRND